MNPIYDATVEAEMCVLGSMMLSERACREALGYLTPDQFVSPANRTIFAKCADLHSVGVAVDLVTVKAELVFDEDLAKVGGTEFLIQVNEMVPSPGNCLHYAKIVRDRWVVREATRRVQAILDAGPSQDPKSILERLERATNGLYLGGDNERGIDEILSDVLKPLERMSITTGVPALDASMEQSGISRTETTVVKASTGRGKSALMAQMTLGQLRAGHRVGWAILEMSDEAIFRRLLRQITGWSDRPRLSTSEACRFDAAVEELRGFKDQFFVRDFSRHGNQVQDVAAWVERLSDKGCEVAFIDYFQKLRTRGTYGYEATCECEERIADLAGSCRIAIVMGSQVRSRDGVLVAKGGAGIEEDAAAVFKADVDEGLEIEKNRHGKSRVKIPASWNPSRLVFDGV